MPSTKEFESMMRIPLSDIAPISDTAYQPDIDYTINEYNEILPIKIDSQSNLATRLRWLREYTMAGGKLSACLRIKQTFISTTTPIMAALAIQDSEWLDYLLNNGVDVHVFGYLPLDRAGMSWTTGKWSTAFVALTWDINVFRKIVLAGTALNPGELSQIILLLWLHSCWRYLDWGLKYPSEDYHAKWESSEGGRARHWIMGRSWLLDANLPFDTNKVPESCAIAWKEAEKYLIEVATLVDGKDYGMWMLDDIVDCRVPRLLVAIQIKSPPLVRLFLGNGSEPNYVQSFTYMDLCETNPKRYSYKQQKTSPVLFAISIFNFDETNDTKDQEKDIIRALAEAGDIECKQSCYVWDINQRTEFEGSAIEFAAHMHKLEELNQVLGRTSSNVSMMSRILKFSKLGG
jgi:hypothetical protein